MNKEKSLQILGYPEYLKYTLREILIVLIIYFSGNMSYNQTPVLRRIIIFVIILLTSWIIQKLYFIINTGASNRAYINNLDLPKFKLMRDVFDFKNHTEAYAAIQSELDRISYIIYASIYFLASGSSMFTIALFMSNLHAIRVLLLIGTVSAILAYISLYLSSFAFKSLEKKYN